MFGDLFDTTGVAHARCPTLHLAARLALGSISAWANALSKALTPNPPSLASSLVAAHVALIARENLIVAKFIQSLVARTTSTSGSGWCPPVLRDLALEINKELLRHTDSVPYTDCSQELATLTEWVSARGWSVIGEVPSHAGTVSLIFDIENPEGTRLIAKVLRTGITERLRASREEAWMLVPLIGRLGGLGTDIVQKGLDTIGDMLMKQTDLIIEKKNCERFGKACQHIKGLVVPKIIEATPDLLVMERYEGVPLSCLTSSEEETREYCRVLIKAWIVSTLFELVVHGDMHAGNVLFNETERTVGIVDFGLVYEAPEDERKRMLAAIGASAEQCNAVEEYTFEKAISDIVVWGLLEPYDTIDALNADTRNQLRTRLSLLLERIIKRQDLGLGSGGEFWRLIRSTPGCEQVSLSMFGYQAWQSVLAIRSVAMALCDDSPRGVSSLAHETAKELLHLELFDAGS